jgi:hypothetical protein
MDNVVKVSSIDGHVWNIGPIGLELQQKLNQHTNIILDLLNEGPDLTETNLYPLLKQLHTAGVRHEQIKILTGNMVEKFNLFEVQRRPEFMFELTEFQKVASRLTKEKTINYHFGCLIGRSNLPRLIVSSHLWDQYPTQTFQTFHYQSQSDYHRSHLGLEDLLFYFGIDSEEYDQAERFLRSGPKTRDAIQSYPILHPENLTGPCTWYSNFFVDIVCETFHSGDTFFVTEKLWRAVATRTPFIIQGPTDTLKRLRQLGFQTFNQWWDEGYDEDPYYYKLHEIKKTVNHISKFNIDELNTMYNQMQSVLDHNYNRMMTLTYEELLSVS